MTTNAEHAATDPRAPLRLGRLALTAAVAGAGGTAFEAMGFPAGWLSGATLAVAGLALFGRAEQMPSRAGQVVFFLLGLTMGAGVTPDALARLDDWPVSLAGLIVTVAVVIVGVYAVLRAVGGFDRVTAFFASIPGALSYVIAVAMTSSADLRAVVISQCVRLLALVVLLPAFIVLGGASGPGGDTVPTAGWDDLAVLFVAGAIGAAVFQAARMPAGVLTGAFAMSAILHGLGFVEGTLPEPVLIACYVATGILIGARMAGTSFGELRRFFAAGAAGFAASLVICGVGALAVAAVTDMPLGPLLLAFAPGGVEAMTIIAFILGADPAFVAFHQLVRFILLAMIVPIVARAVLKV